MNKSIDQYQVILCDNKKSVKTTLPKHDIENILYYIYSLCYYI